MKIATIYNLFYDASRAGNMLQESEMLDERDQLSLQSDAGTIIHCNAKTGACHG